MCLELRTPIVHGIGEQYPDLTLPRVSKGHSRVVKLKCKTGEVFDRLASRGGSTCPKRLFGVGSDRGLVKTLIKTVLTE